MISLKDNLGHLLENTNFYVKTLIPPITPTNIHIGDKVFNMSLIPGREKSMLFCKTTEAQLGDTLVAGLNKSILCSKPLEGEGTVLNADTHLIIPEVFSDQLSQNYSNITTIQDLNQSTKIQESRFMNMFNNYKYSDLFIILKSGNILYLHKFILSAWYCDDDAIKENQYYVFNIDDEIVLKTFKYLYSDGNLDIDDIIDTEDCIQLCKQFGLDRHQLRKKSLKASPIQMNQAVSKEYETWKHSANFIEELSPNVYDYDMGQFDNDNFSQRNLYHSTPFCPVARNNILPSNISGNLSDPDLFGSFSRNISLSFDESPNNSPSNHRKVHSRSPSMNKSATDNVLNLSAESPRPSCSNELGFGNLPTEIQVQIDIPALNNHVSPALLINAQNFDDETNAEFGFTTSSKPYCDDIQSDVTPCMSDHSYSSSIDQLKSPKSNTQRQDSGYDYLLSPLPLAERLKLLTRDNETKVIIPTNNEIPKVTVKQTVPLRKSLKDKNKKSPVKKPAQLRKSISEKITKKSLKRQSIDTLAEKIEIVQSAVKVCMNENIKSYAIDLTDSPKSNEDGNYDRHDFPLSPLPLSDRLKLHVQSLLDKGNNMKLSIGDASKTVPVKKPGKPRKSKDDNEKTEPVKKTAKLRKSLSENIQKKPTKRQSTDSLNNGNLVVEPKKKKVNKIKFESPPRQPIQFNPFTPMPAFDQMPSPELQRLRIKYGMKKELSKKKSIILLEECHRHTHQVDTGIDSEESSMSDASDSSDEDDVLTADHEDIDDGEAVNATTQEHLHHFLKANYFVEILTYKALDVTKIIEDLKFENIKQNLKDLYDYLDYQCISYKKVDDKVRKFNKPLKTKNFVI